MDVGPTLRRARMRKRLTLEQIAQSTKIHLAALEALENDDFDRLPAGVYTRGFLRAFAREVDLDPEELVEQYMEQTEAAAPAPPMTAADQPVDSRALAQGRPVESRSRAQARSESIDEPAREIEAPRKREIVIPRFVPIPALVALLMLAGAGWYFGVHRQGGDAAVASTAEAATPAPQPAAAPASDVARASNVEPDTLRIELTATGPCWVSATADHESALSKLLQAGDRHEIQAKDELVLRVGDPSTVAISVNGVTGRPLGRPGMPVTVQINKQNFREFQAS